MRKRAAKPGSSHIRWRVSLFLFVTYTTAIFPIAVSEEEHGRREMVGIALCLFESVDYTMAGERAVVPIVVDH